MATRVVTFGTFDVFHVGHVNILRRARELGDWLAVGISTDALNFSKKGTKPVYSYDERSQIVAAVRYVDCVFPEESLELKASYLREYKADILVMGDDWAGKFDHFRDIVEVRYLPRTPNVSSTLVKSTIRLG